MSVKTSVEILPTAANKKRKMILVYMPIVSGRNI